jgi:hypothetical protein
LNASVEVPAVVERGRGNLLVSKVINDVLFISESKWIWIFNHLLVLLEEPFALWASSGVADWVRFSVDIGVSLDE